MKKTAIFILVALMAFSLFACASPESTDDTPANDATEATGENTASEDNSTNGSAEAPEGNTPNGGINYGTPVVIAPAGEYQTETVTLSIMRDIGTFTPWKGFNQFLVFAQMELYEPLMFWDREEKQLVSVLAKDFEQVEDGVYDVHLYENIVDSNGNPMTASDVVFSFNKAIEAGGYVFALAPLKSVEAKDDYTVTFNLENEKKMSIEIMLSQIYIVTEAGFEQSGDEMVGTPVGTGPYKLRAYTPSSVISLEAREDYWQSDVSLRAPSAAANAKYLELVCLSDKTSNTMALSSGSIDLSFAIADEDQATFVDFDSLTGNPGYTFHYFPGGELRMISFNCSENSPCSDVNLRKAIAYAVDAEGIRYSTDRYIGVTYKELAANPTFSDCPEESVADDGEYFAYNVETAKEYLDKSSYNGEVLKLIVPSGDEGKVTAATLISSYAEAIGVKIEVQVLEDAIYDEQRLDETGTIFDIDLMSNENFFATWSALQNLDVNAYSSGVNHCFINDPELQRLYDAMAAKDSTTEDILAFTNYVDENCYVYATVYCNHVNYGNDRVARFIEGGRTMLVGAMEYND